MGESNHRWLVIAAAALAVAGCDAAPSSSPPPAAPAVEKPAPKESVEFAACGVVYAGPRCELAPERRLTFWAPGERTLRAFSDRGAVAFAATDAVQGGTRYALTVPSGATFVELRASGASAGFRLAVSDPQPVPLLTEAGALRGRGEYAEARAALERGMPTLSAPLQARARALLARIALSEGDFATAARGLRASMADALADRRTSEAIYDASALAYVLMANLHEYAEARQVLARAQEVSAHDPASRALLPHYAGLLALETGDMRSALAQFREAALRCERLALDDHLLLARQNEATALGLLGRHMEAIRLQQQLLERFPPRDACRAVDGHERLAWTAILAGTTLGGDALAIARQASDSAAAELARCKSTWRERNHLINAGLLALQQNDLAAATDAVARLRRMRGGEDALLLTWESELRGRVELAVGHTVRALAAFRRALALAQRAALWDSEHLAWVGIGRSLEQLGPHDAVLDAYAAADRIMDRLLGGIPIGEGQAGFLREREAGTERLVALLAASGRSEEALRIARHARARVLRSFAHPARLARMDAQARARWEAAVQRYRQLRDELERAQADAWRLPADRLAASQAAFDLARRDALGALDAAHALLASGAHEVDRAPAAPRSNEALLAYFPAGDEVIAFIAHGERTYARWLSGVPGSATRAELGALLLSPFRAELSGVERVRLITHGALAQLDLHALELDGEPLLARHAVVYALDGAPRGESSSVQRSGMLIVADPAADLPAAAREGERVMRALGVGATSLLARGGATRARVLAALPAARLFHYAGHGQFAGTEGVDSGLLLADGQLALGDVLTLPSVPSLVVLSACEGARGDGAGFAGGLSLALAFVVAGADAVVAATRPVADDAADALLEAFYRARGASGDPVEALRKAQLGLRAAQPAADWASFRVIVP